MVRVGESERRHASSSCHLMFTHLPVHGFGGTPGNGHFFGNLGPHVGFESGTEVKNCSRNTPVSPGVVQADLVRRMSNIPLVQPRELILTVLIPLTPPLQVVLVMKSTRDGTTTWQMFADVFPFHAFAAKLDDFCIFLCRPFRLLLRWRLGCQRGCSIGTSLRRDDRRCRS